MTILFVYPRMFHPHRGGIERVTDILCKEFVKRGHHVLYLHSIRDETILDYLYPAPIYFFPAPVNDLVKNGIFYQGFLKEHQVDIVINQDVLSYSSLFLYSKYVENVYTISVIHNSPLILYGHLGTLTLQLRNHSFIEYIKRLLRFFKIPMLKKNYLKYLRIHYMECIANSELLCLLSEKFIPELLRIFPANMSKVIAIGNPNTYSVLSNVVYSKKKQLLYVGRLVWNQKRVDRLVDIWKRLYKDFPDWEMVIVGGGPMEQELKRRCSHLERVIFTGFQDPEPYYKEGCILCLTSDFEGWGMVLTEAMTFGVVPVAFNSFAAVTDIIEDGETGILVPPFSCKKFSDELKRLMKDEELRERMSQSCMHSVGRFNIERIANQWETQFVKLKDPSVG